VIDNPLTQENKKRYIIVDGIKKFRLARRSNKRIVGFLESNAKGELMLTFASNFVKNLVLDKFDKSKTKYNAGAIKSPNKLYEITMKEMEQLGIGMRWKSGIWMLKLTFNKGVANNLINYIGHNIEAIKRIANGFEALFNAAKDNAEYFQKQGLVLQIPTKEEVA